MYTNNCSSAGAFNILCITTDAGQVNPTKRPPKQARWQREIGEGLSLFSVTSLSFGCIKNLYNY
jgi:hypothetical protein